MNNEQEIRKKYDKISQELLIKRGGLLMEAKKIPLANNDFAQAARIMEVDSSQKTTENIENLRKYLFGLSIQKNSNDKNPTGSKLKDESSDGGEKVSTTTSLKNSTNEKVSFQESTIEILDKVFSIFYKDAPDTTPDPTAKGSLFIDVHQKLSNPDTASKCKNLLEILEKKILNGHKMSHIYQRRILELYASIYANSMDFIDPISSNTIESENLQLSPNSQISDLIMEILEADMDENLDKAKTFLQEIIRVSNIETKESISQKELGITNTGFNIIDYNHYISIQNALTKAILISLSSENSEISNLANQGNILYFSKVFFCCNLSNDIKIKTKTLRNAVKLVSNSRIIVKDIFNEDYPLVSLYSSETPLSTISELNIKTKSLKSGSKELNNSEATNSIKRVHKELVPGSLIQLLWDCGSSDKQIRAIANVFISLYLQKLEEPTKKKGADKKQELESRNIFVSYSKKILSDWLQSTKQSDKRRGYLTLASIFSVQSSNLGTEILTDSLSVESLFDSYENDLPETNLSLLELCDSLLGKTGYLEMIEEFGLSFLVLCSDINSIKNTPIKSDLVTNLTKAIATKILCKLSVYEKNEIIPKEQNPNISKAHISTLKESIDSSELLENCANTLGSKENQNLEIICNISEGVSYLSLQSKLKNKICVNPSIIPKFLDNLKDETSQIKASDAKNTLLFTTISTISNLVYRKPILSEEQQSADKIRQAATKNKSNQISNDEKELIEKIESNESVDKRCLLLSRQNGIFELIVSAVSTKSNPSETMKDAVISIILSFSCVPQIRGVLVQQGCVNALVNSSSILSIPKGQSNGIKEFLNKTDANATHALAKIAIFLPPQLAFPDNSRVSVNSLIRPFLMLCASSGHDQLCVFEALLALTNFASIGPGSSETPEECPGYLIVNTYKGLDIIEMLVLSNMCLIRRAATELICNLVASVETAFEYFITGVDKIPEESFGKQVTEEEKTKYQSHKLHLLAALCDFDLDNNLDINDKITNNSDFDPRTVLAASGTLATLTNDPSVARFLICCHPRFHQTLLNLLSCGVLDFIHRGLVIFLNCLNSENSSVKSKLKRNLDLVSIVDKLTNITPEFFVNSGDPNSEILIRKTEMITELAERCNTLLSS
ncbi:hypothetical protein BB558_003280 [Smittium angustum]|uniref:UNC-45/Cro1/She4 central domain-containing protein n=1 Tax=Smittium angustum TaxID=133377 RepID=A0A2U1J6G5_SMIAN|nr:hypothetical protein BB558_005198 [Smittium angustum]PWA00667.1 hypothetical protein BB558_003280 [Smittium angustum]